MASILSTRIYFLLQFILIFSICADVSLWYLYHYYVPSWVVSAFCIAGVLMFYVVRELEKPRAKRKKADKSVGREPKRKVEPDEQHF